MHQKGKFFKNTGNFSPKMEASFMQISTFKLRGGPQRASQGERKGGFLDMQMKVSDLACDLEDEKLQVS